MQCFIFHLQQHFTGWNEQPALNSCNCLTPGERFCLTKCYLQTLYFLLCHVQAHLPNHRRVLISEKGWVCRYQATVTHCNVLSVFGLVEKLLKSTEGIVLSLVSFSQALNNQLILLFLHSSKSTGFACPVFLVLFKEFWNEEVLTLKRGWMEISGLAEEVHHWFLHLSHLGVQFGVHCIGCRLFWKTCLKEDDL